MSTANAYLRYPHISSELLTFTADDDIWLVGVEGGRAWRVTSDHAPVRQPRLSPDGAHIAFISFRDGHPEVMLADVETGSVRRLTWWGGSNTVMLGWDGTDRVLAASNAAQHDPRQVVTRAVSPDAETELLEIGATWGLATHPDGTRALVTPGSRQPSHWKRYRGGTAPRLWLDHGNDQWTRLLPDDEAGITDPMWLGDALVFSSDRAATFPDNADEPGNLWRWETPGEGEPQQLTYQSPDEGYVRDATTDGTRIVWHSRGRIRMLDNIHAEPRTLDITLPGTEPQPVSLDPTANLTTLSPDVTGDASLVGWRGKTFWLTHDQGPARALAADSGVRTREQVVLGDTGMVAYVTDAAGDDAIEIRTADGSDEPRRLLSGELGRVLHLAADPAGDRLAAISHDGAIRLIKVASGSATQIDHSDSGEALCPRFSPDGRYLVWSHPTGGEGDLHQLRVFDTRAGADPVVLTSGQYHDHSPAFSRDGKYVVFLSDRTFDPHYNDQSFDLGFLGSRRPWLIPLSATEPPPFGPAVAGWPAAAAKPDTTGGAEEVPEFDFDDAEERIVAFPVPSAHYRSLDTTKDGVVWIREADEVGVLGTRRASVSAEAPTDRLERWSLSERKLSTLVDKADSFAVSGDRTRVVVRAGDSLTALPADRKAEDEDSAKVAVDLTRLRFEVDLRAEWKQMFTETGTLMRDHFWRADMDGVDWAAITRRWTPVVDQVRSHDDLVDLLWEYVGELNTSHAYVMPQAPLGDASRRLGFLGADLSPAEGGWRIDRVLPGESSEPRAASPLRQAGVGAREGDLVVAVDGQPVDPAVGPSAQLLGAADKPTELTLRRDGSDRRVVVVPLADEEVLRYQDWVRSRREYVREHSAGRLGYVHVPDMQSYGWAQLHRDLRHATRAEGVIADVRFNRGGHTSQLVIERLAAQVIAWVVGRHYGSAVPDPDRANRGPVILVANENSGSDGDIVNARAQALGVGPVVGVRTWGGVVGIDGRFDLIDGTGVTQPRYAYWLRGKGFGVENHGVDPDIEVVHDPAQLFQADDPQLDRAIAEAFARLDEGPAAQPPEMPEPKYGSRP